MVHTLAAALADFLGGMAALGGEAGKRPLQHVKPVQPSRAPAFYTASSKVVAAARVKGARVRVYAIVCG